MIMNHLVKRIKGVEVQQMSKKSDIVRHVKDPIRYPKVQCGYEGVAQVMIATQTNNMTNSLTEEMLKLIK